MAGMWQLVAEVDYRLRGIYTVLVKNEAVYLFYLVPIAYFMTIVGRLIYYKLKYHLPIYFRDIIAGATMFLIFVDYINYLRLLVSGTGKVLPFPALFVKYTIGFLLWMWMFWYSYQVHLKNSLKGKHFHLKRRHAVVLFVVAMVIILLIIGIVLAPPSREAMRCEPGSVMQAVAMVLAPLGRLC